MASPAERGVEQAISVARIVLATFGTVSILGAEALRSDANVATPLSVASIVLGGAVGLGYFGARLERVGPSGQPLRRSVVLQAAETAWFLVLATSLRMSVADAAWVLLVVPIVIASLRQSERSVLATWSGSLVGYVVADHLLFGQELGGSAQRTFERMGVLLAVAACIALLTRWLRDGWATQRALTVMAEQRSMRLGVIEEAARAMRAVDPEGVLRTCVAAVPRLGFDAAVATDAGRPVFVAGAGELVPHDLDFATDEPDAINITCWTGPAGDTVYSASKYEPKSRLTISGWARDEIDSAMAKALADLVANAASAYEGARHLASARDAAKRDPLTSLANRAELGRQLEAAAATSQPLAALFMDLDHFKEINDTHGHLVGDHLLVAMAGRLRRVMNGHGLLARYGGDEFVLLVTGELATEALALGERIRQTLAKPFALQGLELTISVSVGVASAIGPLDPAALLARADEAVYAAKGAGRNVVRGEHRRAIEPASPERQQ